jgi:DnaK suppressor protein
VILGEFAGHALCFGRWVMSGFETEARQILLRRRTSLHRQVGLGADPEARWTDYEGAPEPLAPGVRRELSEIDEALRRIAEGKYGRCLACGGPMGLQRMRALPEARYCVGCSGHELSAD